MSFLKADNASHFIELHILLQIFLFPKAGFLTSHFLFANEPAVLKKNDQILRSDLENLFKPHGALLAPFFVLHLNVCTCTSKSTSQK